MAHVFSQKEHKKIGGENMRQRLISIIVCTALALSLCGCSQGTAQPRGTLIPESEATSSPAPSTAAAVSTSHFEKVWRGDIKYSDMEYEHYQRQWLDEYTAPIYDLAENGGTQEQFDEADFNLTDELYYIQTLLTLISLKQSADPDDKETADELLYAQEMSYTASDEYWNAMHAMAASPHADLMSAVYDEVLISAFRQYEPSEDDSELSAYNAENELISEYYRLMAQPEPDTDAVAEVFTQLVELRRAEAESSGYDNYADYAYDMIYSKDYTPEDAQVVWQGVKDYIVPVMNRHSEHVFDEVELLQSSGAIDCSSSAIISAMDSILPKVSSELYDAFRYMLDYELYDIEHDVSKANTGYTSLLYYVNEPFIFNAAYDEFYDYTDMFHEFGHFTNGFYTESDMLFGISDNDLSELQSQGMELLFTHYYDEIFGEYADAARGYLLMNMIYSIVDGALYDEFQQRIYSEPELTPDKVNEIYAELYEEYGYTPYDGYETEWLGISHNFESPFYYISYSVSALGALELYKLMEESWEQGVDKYLTVCAMDTEMYYYSEALSEAGLKDIFDPETYSSIASVLEESFS